jgi:acyl-CoA synthetase (AMP-forming)/AMP-acid ligase II
MIHYPLLTAFRSGATFATRSGIPITVEAFLGDVAELARLLPDRGHVVNLCRDRYRFAAGFAAALCRRQINLLPPGESAETLHQLSIDYPDLYCLADAAPETEPGGPPVFTYPSTLIDASGIDASGIDGSGIHASGVRTVPEFPAEQPAAVLFTSGSTGRPQPHGRTWGELVLSARAAGRRLGVASMGPASLLGTVPHQHSYGLESLLMLALQHGLILHAGRPFYPSDIIAELAAAPRPRLFVTTPVHLRVLLGEAAELPPVDLVLSATAPLSVELARDAEARFAINLSEIYGCSEAGQIATRRSALTEEWHCLDGITLRQDVSGTWASGAPIARETLLSDAIELRDPERFLLRGRLADLVNVAGKRTSLAHLNHHLTAIEGVRDGAFVASDDDKDTARLMAFAVAPGLTAVDVLAALRERIDAAFLPRPLHLVAALPRNSLGKLPREEVERLVALSTRGGTSGTGM